MKIAEQWEIYKTDTGWWWHLCIPFSREHGPFKTDLEAEADTRKWSLDALYAEAEQNEHGEKDA